MLLHPQKPRLDAAPDAPQTAMPIVHVVDDEPAIQGLFRQMCQLERLQVRAYDCAVDYLRQHSDDAPGCLVLDLNLPDMSGLQVLQELSQRGSTIPVVFMSGIASVADAVRALKLGSLDFVEKPFALHDMLGAIRRALAADADRRRSHEEHERIVDRFLRLTPREQEVMELVVQGLPNKAVAARLGVSHKTVEVHRANVMRKTGANSLPELVKLRLLAAEEPAKPH